MSGRRLVDAAAMVKAARGVVSKYAALQRRQLDIYSKTSSITRAVRYQTSEGTFKVGAGSVRVKGSGKDLNEHAPGKETPVTSQASTIGGRKQVEKKYGLEQDHFYTKSEANTTAQPLPDSELDIRQENAKRYPLPDGSIPPAKPDISVPKRDQDAFSETTKRVLGKDSLAGKINGANSSPQPVLPGGTSIPDPEVKAKLSIPDRTLELQSDPENQIPSVSAEHPNARLQSEATPQDPVAGKRALGLEQDVFHTRSSKATRALSPLPRVMIPKVTGATQGGNFQVSDDQINQDVFYSAPSKDQQQPIPEVQALPEQEQPSDDMYSEIFQSPRVAKLLKGERKQGNPASDLKPRAVHDTPVEQANLSQDKDQESFNIRPTGQETPRAEDHHNLTKDPSQSKKADAEDAHKLAEAMAQDVASAASARSKVSIDIHLLREVLADKLTAIP